MKKTVKIKYVSSKDASDYLLIIISEQSGKVFYDFAGCSSCGVFHKVNAEAGISLSKKTLSTKNWSISLELTDEDTIKIVEKFVVTKWNTGYISYKEVEELFQKLNPMK